MSSAPLEPSRGTIDQLRELVDDLPAAFRYGRRLDERKTRILSILDIYQHRALSARAEVVEVGILDGAMAVSRLRPDVVLVQTTGATWHTAWAGKIATGSRINDHLAQLVDAAKMSGVRVVVLCTAAPDALADHAGLLALADLVISPRSDTSALLRSREDLGGRLLTGPDAVERFGPCSTSRDADPALRVLVETFCAAALRAAAAQAGGPR